MPLKITKTPMVILIWSLFFIFSVLFFLSGFLFSASGTMSSHNTAQQQSFLGTTLAPFNPIEDWYPTPDGQFINKINGNRAMFKRNTVKTQRRADGSLMIVPANQMAVEPWFLHNLNGSGWAAIIEESRTNLLQNTWFSESENNLGTGIQYSLNGATVSFNIEPSPIYGNTQVFLYTNNNNNIVSPSIELSSVPINTSPTDPFVGSLWISGEGGDVVLSLVAKRNDGSIIGEIATSSTYTLNNQPVRVSVQGNAVPVGTNHITVKIKTNISNNSTAILKINCIQLEKGVGASSYIPTTNTIATRDADTLFIPTTEWSTSAGTISFISNQLVPSENISPLLGSVYNEDFLNIYTENQSLFTEISAGGNITTLSHLLTPSSPVMLGVAWQQGVGFQTHNAGVLGVSSGSGSMPFFSTMATIGTDINLSNYSGQAIQRILVHERRLTQTELTTTYNALINGVTTKPEVIPLQAPGSAQINLTINGDTNKNSSGTYTIKTQTDNTIVARDLPMMKTTEGFTATATGLLNGVNYMVYVTVNDQDGVGGTTQTSILSDYANFTLSGYDISIKTPEIIPKINGAVIKLPFAGDSNNNAVINLILRRTGFSNSSHPMSRNSEMGFYSITISDIPPSTLIGVSFDPIDSDGVGGIGVNRVFSFNTLDSWKIEPLVLLRDIQGQVFNTSLSPTHRWWKSNPGTLLPLQIHPAPNNSNYWTNPNIQWWFKPVHHENINGVQSLFSAENTAINTQLGELGVVNPEGWYGPFDFNNQLMLSFLKSGSYDYEIKINGTIDYLDGETVVLPELSGRFSTTTISPNLRRAGG